MNENVWFASAYDDIVGAEADGLEQDKIRDSLAREYLNAVERGEIEVASEMDAARAKAEHYLRPIRRSRKDSFRKEVRYLLDALNDDTILGAGDPRLSQAVPVGNGKDKKLALWSAEDWITAVKARQKNVQDAAQAATEFSDIAAEVIGRMTEKEARMFGDMFGGAA